MYRPEHYDADYPDLRDARQGARELLYGPVAHPPVEPGDQPVRAGVAAWAPMHGLATLLLTGNLPAELCATPTTSPAMWRPTCSAASHEPAPPAPYSSEVSPGTRDAGLTAKVPT
jgi:hypothetical protein